MTIRSRIFDFCKQKLARILFDCVNCSHEKRDMLDWFTAEDFIREYPYIVENIINDFLFQPQIAATYNLEPTSPIPPDLDMSYEALDQIIGRSVWDRLYQPLRRVLECRIRKPHYTSIAFG